MKNLINLYPELEKEILSFESDFNHLKKFIIITSPKAPTYDKKKDVSSYLKHFINIIQLRLISQISLIREGLILENPEVYSVVRSSMETIAAMAYIADRVPKEYENGQYEEAVKITTKAFMGRRTKTINFDKNIEIANESDKSINVLTYVEKATKLVSKALKKDSNYYMTQYERISEYTHPNYNALEMYWKLVGNKVVYKKNTKNLTEENLGIILHLLLTLIPVYLLFLKKIYKFQSSLDRSN